MYFNSLLEAGKNDSLSQLYINENRTEETKVDLQKLFASIGVNGAVPNNLDSKFISDCTEKRYNLYWEDLARQVDEKKFTLKFEPISLDSLKPVLLEEILKKSQRRGQANSPLWLTQIFSTPGERLVQASPFSISLGQALNEELEDPSLEETKEEVKVEENTEANAHWESLIQQAYKRSPGAKLADLPEAEREEKLKEDWLVQDPLTGVCLGLAIDFILQQEAGQHPMLMEPSPNVRYWEKSLIPAMLKTMDDANLSSHLELNQNEHYCLVYGQMIHQVDNKTGLNSRIVAMHNPLEGLSNIVQGHSGHLLVSLEKPGNGVAENHVVYINPTTKMIADGGCGLVIQLEGDDDFDGFLSYYMDSFYGHSFNQFSLIFVEKKGDIRMPSRFDRAQLTAKLLFDKGMRSLKAYIN